MRENLALKQTKLSPLGDGLVLTLSSAIAYSSVWAYECGYATYFGYPYWVIKIEFLDVLVVWMSVALIIAMVFQMLVLLIGFLPATATFVLLRSLARSLLPILGAYLMWVALQPNQVVIAVLLVVFLGLLVIEPLLKFFVIPLLTRTEASWIKRLEAGYEKFVTEEKRREASEPETVLTRIHKIPGLSRSVAVVYLAGLLMMFTFMVAYKSGKVIARNNDQFMVSNGDPSLVIIRRYGDLVVLAPIDVTRKKIHRRFRFYPTTEIDAFVWSPLHLHGAAVDEID